MSLRHVEEGLTALSYPHVAYYLRGEQGYGRPRPSWLDEGDMPLHRRPQVYGSAGSAAGSAAAGAASTGGSAASAAGESAGVGVGGGFGIIAALAKFGSAVANTVTSFQMTAQAKEMTKQTAAQTEAQRDIAEANVDIAYSNERIRAKEAEVQAELNRNMYLLEMERRKSVPVMIGAGLAGVVVLAVVFAPRKVAKTTTSAQQTQKQKSRVRQAQRSL